jgi:transposase
MKNKRFIGIDVSKKVLDLFILQLQFHFTVTNDPLGYAQFLETCCVKLSCKEDELFLCFENTGRYSRLLSVFLHENNILYAMVPALDIKQSKGLTRGKTDKMDARSIALYAWRKKDELVPTKLHSAEVGQLRQLLGLRDKLVRHRTSYKNAIKDLNDCFFEGETNFLRQTQLRMIEQYNAEIKNVEEQIEAIILTNSSWSKNYTLIQSVRGIGPVIAKYLIIYTENFTRFSNPKKFACFAGIAPFEYSSGSSIKGRTRLHPCANKQLKSLLNIAAMGAVQLKGEYSMYYQRRVQEGKNKMSTLNIIRNKLVLRVFAVVKRQTPYVDLTTFAA